MKKILLVAAIAALSQQATAEIYTISSDIKGVQLWVGNKEKVDIPGGSASGFFIDGTINDSNNDGVPEDIDITFAGEIITSLGPLVRITFALTSDDYTPDEGVIMNGGTMTLEIDADGSGFAPYQVIDVAKNPFSFKAGANGFLAPCPAQQCTTGLLLEGEGFPPNPENSTDDQHIPLPGLYSGNFFGDGWHSGVSVVTLLGNTAGMFLEGTVTRAPVPVPAAAWLFGSALLGLVGVGRRKK